MGVNAARLSHVSGFMRIRLLLDTELSSSEIEELQRFVELQPPATVQIEGGRLLGARFMGAQPVETAEQWVAEGSKK